MDINDSNHRQSAEDDEDIDEEGTNTSTTADKERQSRGSGYESVQTYNNADVDQH
eukprot:CAMPEP_0198149978 /NCGR_PEP_ID=MMETSP1443-20131203/48878_1 /TAXON_ID=186043 /ORGANISM="Entomoneis sp., Strain CCMP2396" /LENGTH=54 /DNA_ID=CAMNT_0043815157 /DNA_START=68 /DNA_END=229 /DNA_ORIENTATION=-